MNSINPLASLPSLSPAPQASQVSQAENTFAGFLNSTLDQVDKAQQEGYDAVAKLNTGEAKNMHEVMIAVEQADLSLRMLVQVRNKALQAYNDIIGMQI
jgi:flagellar hook-basal body complex protein FliE